MLSPSENHDFSLKAFVSVVCRAVTLAPGRAHTFVGRPDAKTEMSPILRAGNARPFCLWQPTEIEKPATRRAFLALQRLNAPRVGLYGGGCSPPRTRLRSKFPLTGKLTGNSSQKRRPFRQCVAL